MRVERTDRDRLMVTASASELAALVAAARLTADAPPEGMAPEAVAHLRVVLSSYDRALAALRGERLPT